MQRVPIGTIKNNPNNPRVIKDDKFKKLVQSIKDLPEMAEVRPVVVNTDMVVLGGNMRLKAMREAGWKDVPIQVVDWDEDKQRQFIIKDNVSGGEWDWDMLANEWDSEQLKDWGIDLPVFAQEDEKQEAYTGKIDAPVYEPKNQKPEITVLYDTAKYADLVAEIESSTVSNDIKTFLKVSASRHIVFNYENIADFYAHSDKDVQELMEKSALVIIDFEKAIELGFTKLNDEIANQYRTDYE